MCTLRTDASNTAQAADMSQDCYDWSILAEKFLPWVAQAENFVPFFPIERLVISWAVGNFFAAGALFWAETAADPADQAEISGNDFRFPGRDLRRGLERIKVVFAAKLVPENDKRWRGLKIIIGRSKQVTLQKQGRQTCPMQV